MQVVQELIAASLEHDWQTVHQQVRLQGLLGAVRCSFHTDHGIWFRSGYACGSHIKLAKQCLGQLSGGKTQLNGASNLRMALQSPPCDFWYRAKPNFCRKRNAVLAI